MWPVISSQSTHPVCVMGCADFFSNKRERNDMVRSLVVDVINDDWEGVYVIEGRNPLHRVGMSGTSNDIVPANADTCAFHWSNAVMYSLYLVSPVVRSIRCA